MLKKLTILLGIFLILVTGVAFAAEEEGITVLVNGEPLVSEVPPQKLLAYDEDGNCVGARVMISLSSLGEKLNCDICWNPETRGITLYRKNKVTMMWIGEEAAFQMENYGLTRHYPMDVPPTLIEDKTMVPIRATSELLGATVDWFSDTNTVSINYDFGELEDNAGIAEQLQIYGLFLQAQYDDYVSYFNGTLDTTTGAFVLEDGREIKFELYPQFAPQTCARFIECAQSGFYDGTIFHRVIEGFVAQGGGFNETLTPILADYPNLPGEFLANGHFNLIPHNRGILSFARTDDLDGGGTQFFLVHQDSSYLNGYYATFGKVTEGLELVDEICSTETDQYDIPITPIVVKTILIDEK